MKRQVREHPTQNIPPFLPDEVPSHVLPKFRDFRSKFIQDCAFGRLRKILSTNHLKRRPSAAAFDLNVRTIMGDALVDVALDRTGRLAVDPDDKAANGMMQHFLDGE